MCVTVCNMSPVVRFISFPDLDLLIALGSRKDFVNYTFCEVAQLCPSLCDPMDCSLPGSSIHGIFQARVLEWVAISFSNLHVLEHD